MLLPQARCLGLALCYLFHTTSALDDPGSSRPLLDLSTAPATTSRQAPAARFPAPLGLGGGGIGGGIAPRSTLPRALRPLETALQRAAADAALEFSQQRPNALHSAPVRAPSRPSFPFAWPAAQAEQVARAVAARPRLAGLWAAIQAHHEPRVATLAVFAQRVLALAAPLFRSDVNWGWHLDRDIIDVAGRLSGIASRGQAPDERRAARADGYAAEAALASLRADVAAGRLRVRPRNRARLAHAVAAARWGAG